MKEERLGSAWSGRSKYIYYPEDCPKDAVWWRYADRYCKSIVTRAIRAILQGNNYYFQERRPPLVYTSVTDDPSEIEIMAHRVWDWGSGIDIGTVCTQTIYFLKSIFLEPLCIEAREGKYCKKAEKGWELAVVFKLVFENHLGSELQALRLLFGDSRNPEVLTKRIVSMLAYESEKEALSSFRKTTNQTRTDARLWMTGAQDPTESQI